MTLDKVLDISEPRKEAMQRAVRDRKWAWLWVCPNSTFRILCARPFLRLFVQYLS